jgi:hypothetical protein
MNFTTASYLGMWEIYDELEKHESENKGRYPDRAKLFLLKAILQELENE